jgi:hypothetical protein
LLYLLHVYKFLIPNVRINRLVSPVMSQFCTLCAKNAYLGDSMAWAFPVTYYNQIVSHYSAAEIFYNYATSDYTFCDLDSSTARSMRNKGTNCAMMCWNSSSNGQEMTVSADSELSGPVISAKFTSKAFFAQLLRCRIYVV